MTLHLMRLQPAPTALAAWSTRHGLSSPDGDFGYAIHALLASAFGDLAPKPFRYLGSRDGLLAYTSTDPEMLRQNAQIASPDVARALGLDQMDSRPFPDTWKSGQRLGFEVRIRPVVRTNDGRERDVFLNSLSEPVNSRLHVSQPESADRSTTYLAWLVKQFAVDDAASITDAHIDAFRLTRVVRKSGNAQSGQRKTKYVCGPDAVFKGQLLVENAEGFSRLLARGLGRHRAFGFGMLLLRPATGC